MLIYVRKKNGRNEQAVRSSGDERRHSKLHLRCKLTNKRYSVMLEKAGARMSAAHFTACASTLAVNNKEWLPFPNVWNF